MANTDLLAAIQQRNPAQVALAIGRGAQPNAQGLSQALPGSVGGAGGGEQPVMRPVAPQAIGRDKQHLVIPLACQRQQRTSNGSKVGEPQQVALFRVSHRQLIDKSLRQAKPHPVARCTFVMSGALPQLLNPIEVLAQREAPHGLLGHLSAQLQHRQARTAPAKPVQRCPQQRTERNAVGDDVLATEAREINHQRPSFLHASGYWLEWLQGRSRMFFENS